MGIWVQAVVDSGGFDLTTWSTGLVRTGEIEVTSTEDLVNKIKGQMAVNGGKLAGLSLFTHGGNGEYHIGKDQYGGISARGQENYWRLGPLRSCFETGASICLCVCEAGRNEDAVLAVARATGVRVYACTGGVYPNLGTTHLGWWRGTVIAANPDGTVDRGVHLP